MGLPAQVTRRVQLANSQTLGGRDKDGDEDGHNSVPTNKLRGCVMKRPVANLHVEQMEPEGMEASGCDAGQVPAKPAPGRGR